MRMDAGLQSQQARFDTSAICSPLGSQSTRHTRAPDAAGLDLTGQGRGTMRRWLVVPLDRDTTPIAPGFPHWTDLLNREHRWAR